MRVIQTRNRFPLSSVKPLGELVPYREYCVAATRRALRHVTRRRERSPVTGGPLEPFGDVGGLAYARCAESGSLFLVEVPEEEESWAQLLAEVSRFRHSPKAFHWSLARSRTSNVYAPKLEWIQETLRLQGVHRPRIVEAVTAPSDFTALLEASGSFAEVISVDEMALTHVGMTAGGDAGADMDVAVLLESLDRIDDPAELLRGVARRLTNEGLLFVTALVCSGFDMAVLGRNNLFLYPPDRTNCYSLRGLRMLLERAGFSLLEVSTPGVLDVEIVDAHRRMDPSLPLSTFEECLLAADGETRAAFQTFLQERGLSSFARIVARKRG